MWRIGGGVIGAALVLSSLGCAGGCPKPGSTPVQATKWEAELAAKRPLTLDPKSSITIKRDVHNIYITAPADRFATAFRQVMEDKTRSFGLIHVDRPRTEADRPFALHSRFQGRYQLDAAIEQSFKGWAKRVFGELVDEPAVKSALCSIENHDTSDFGEITVLDLSPAPGADYKMSYRYLEGSPIAGSSTFVVTPLGADACRLTQVFEYQEQSLSFATFFAAGGLRLHDQVVMSQAQQAVAAISASITDTDIPKEYW